MIRSGDFLLCFRNQNLILTPERAVFWKDRNALIVADLHMGKSGHFRKHGIAVPESVNQKNLHRLSRLVRHFRPDEIYFLGDLFHSHRNEEWDSFSTWKNQHKNIMMYLSIGNHDEYGFSDLEEVGLHSAYEINVAPFTFRHIPEPASGNEFYPLAGHIHPSVKLKGKGRQSAYFPCYYFGRNYGLLPAFGEFTGTHRISPEENETVAAIVEDQVIQLN